MNLENRPDKIMDAVIIGVSDRSSLWRHGSIKKEDYDNFVNEYAVFLNKHFDNLIVVPDEGVYTDIAIEFSKLKGRKATAYYPDKDTNYGYEYLKPLFDKFEVHPIEGDWYKLGAELTKKSLTIICLGFSPGVLIEISYIKYHQKFSGEKKPQLKNIHLFIDERCVEQRLPKTFEEQIKNIYYYTNFDDLEKLIGKSEDIRIYD